MESYNSTLIAKNIYDSGFGFFNLKTLRDILGIKKESTLHNAINKLIKSGILMKLEKNKYILKNAKINNLKLANFLYFPSYISFETALNIHGVISQFPYEIISSTTKKSLEKKINNDIFSYIHLQKSLFWGYRKNGYLMAESEKALLDLAYLSAKGFKKIDLDEYDFTKIDKHKLKSYLDKYPVTRQFIKVKKDLIEKLKL